MSIIEELKTQMAEAVKVFQSTGDMGLIQVVTKAMDKAKAELNKAEATKLLAESEKLAEARETTSANIHEQIKNAGLDAALRAVKAWGFTYKVDRANPNEADISYKSVALSTATVKVHKAGGTGGGNGKSKDEYGMSLQDIVNKFATAEELAAINAEGISNSKSWQLKVAIKKAAIAANKLAPVK